MPPLVCCATATCRRSSLSIRDRGRRKGGGIPQLDLGTVLREYACAILDGVRLRPPRLPSGARSSSSSAQSDRDLVEGLPRGLNTWTVSLGASPGSSSESP